MQLSAASASSSARKALRSRSGSRLRKRHKRLDAICEKEYNRNHSESNERSGGRGSLDADVELRRSSRVRRAPVVLDVSPPPAKKRRKLGQNVKVGFDRSQNSEVGGVKAEEKKGDIEVSGSWRSRLRARVGNTTVMKLKEYERGSSSRRKKLFAKTEEDSHAVEESLEVESQRMMVVKSKRPGRVKAMNGLQGEKGVEICDVKSEEVGDANEEFTKDAVDVSASSSDNETGGREKRNMIEVSDVEDDQKESLNIMLPVETCNEIAIEAENVEERVQNDELQQVECENEGRTPEDVMEAEISTEKGEEKADNEIRDVGSVVELDKSNEAADAKPAENENDAKAADSNQVHFDKVGRSRIRQGRRCGLCGVGSEGKPPKKLTLDNGDSENEAYSSSASEEPNYDKWDGFGDEPGWLGRLLGPINDRHGIPRIWVHQNCAVWSPEVYFAGLGHLKNIRAALCRGRALKCTRCGRTGATIGCRVDRCPRTYHLPCARACGCVFNHRKFLIACTDHKHKFQPAYRYLKLVKKMKARKMKLEMRKVSNDASRRDIEAEEKWLEHCGQDEEFLKRESKRLHRDLMRIAPVYIGGMHTDNGKTHDGWESVAGLQNVIQCMKEVVILPLLYPEFFSNLGLTPPRGVLLHGYPGTGKTLVVRALIGSCARGDKRIAYFARKGADCLGKYVGDAERQLRLLFQVAERCQPSIIFFDEIDGLAPRRTRQQDQTHSSVVSTLLTLLDGLKSRGSVVVIGATNRPDAVDPALRRPGRFDREIYFPLPSMEDRAAILSLHTKRWPKPVSGPVLQWVARKTAGYAGADLQALCTQAAVIALKRNFPLQEIMTAAQGPREDTERVPLPAIAVGERDWLEAISCSPPPCSRREAGVAANDLVACPLPTHLIPCLLQPLSSLLVSLALDQRLCIPPVISRAASLVETVIVSFLDSRRLSKDHWWTYVNDFLQESDILKEIERRLSVEGIIIQGPTFHPYDIFPDYISGESAKAEPSLLHGTGESESVIKNISYVSSKKIGFRMLVAGNPQSGQKHLASCLLNCFVGDIEVLKVDLATISQEGHGDMEQGMNQILMRCASTGKCVIYMPRIDLWAVESSSTIDELADKEDLLGLTRPMSPLQKCESTGSEPRVDVRGASHSWSSFIEQVESICVSTSLIILATSEIPTLLLPHKVRQFFGPNVQGGSGKPSLHYTIPRFSVHVDGKFDHEMVVELSAIELSRDVLQPYVHIAHQRYHLQGNSETEMDQNCPSTRYHDVNQNVGNEVLVDSRSCDLSAKVLPTTTMAKPAFISRPLKGKSSLMLAISSFGYQILRYPHFAELCWVTSKLKEGPSMDISGAWSGWPFNSCIVRPLSLPNTEDIACDHSANLRSKDKYGLVRGLIAVGLLAYRGAYKSLREVSHEVRKVLELLVDRINSKVNAGKDRYQYVRVLSQVAYLEDMVNSWMHALQSLDQGASMAMVNPEPSTPGLADNRLCLASNPGQKGIESNCSEPAGQNIESIYVDRGNACKVHFSDGRIPFSDDGQKIGPFGDTASEPPLGCMDIDNESVNNANMQYKKISDSCCTTNTAILDQDLSSKQANGFVSSRSLDLFSVSDGPVGVNVPRASEGCGKVNGFVAEMQTTCYGMPEPVELVAEATAFSKKASADPGIMCLYRCCSKCLHILHNLMRRIIIQQRTSYGNECTVEDVHDAVASLSVELLSTVNKFFIAGTSTGRFINDQKHEDRAVASCPELSGCHCRRSSLPAVCSCHSANGCSMEGATVSGSESGFNPVFIFRDGVLLPVECKEDVPFHCKFEKLCLCSLVESISMTKQPFD